MATKNELRSAVWQACTAIRNEHRDVKKYVEYTAILLFFKLYDDAYESLPEDIQGLIPEKYRWNTLKSLDPKGFYGFNKEVLVRTREFFEKKLWKNEEQTSAFDLIFENFQFDIKHSEVLGRALISVDKINFDKMDYDHKGDLYEFLIAKMADAGVKGEFFTPRAVVNMIVKVLKPKYQHKIWDPACGTGGFLSRAFEEMLLDLQSKYKIDSEEYKTGLNVLRQESIYGNETESVSARLARMNMILRGDGHSTILEFNSLDQQTYTQPQVEIRGKYQKNPIPAILEEGGFDLIVANPPYGGSQAVSDVGSKFKGWNNTKKPESNFLQVMMNVLKEDGKCGVVLPEGVLFRKEDKKIRERLLKKFDLQAVVGLFKGTFEFAPDVKACVLIFRRPKDSEKWKGTQKVWFAETKTYEDIENIPNCIQQDSELYKTINLSEIEKKDYNLKPSRYLESINDVSIGEIAFSEIFDEVKDTIEILDEEVYKQVTVKLYGKGATLRGEKSGADIGTKRQKLVKQDDLVVSKIDAKSGAFALIPADLENAVVTNDFPIFRMKGNKLLKELFEYYIKYGPITKRLELNSQGTTNRQRVSVDDIMELTLPCPNNSQQKEILNRINIQQQIKNNAANLLKSVNKLDWIDDSLFYFEKEDAVANSFGELVEDASDLIDPTTMPETLFKVYGVSNEDGVRISEEKIGEEFKVGRKYKWVKEGGIIYNPQRVDVGSIGIVNETDETSITSPYYPHFICKDQLDSKFAFYLIKSPYFRRLIQDTVVGAVRHELYFNLFTQIDVRIPKLEKQLEVVKLIDSQLESYKQVQKIYDETEKNIKLIIMDLFK